MTHSRFLKALARQPVDCTPVWLMRQAGRYLPDYRAIRKKAGDFLTLCKTPEYACEVTLQPLRRFDLDAAILFSDILVIADAMGLGLHVLESQGPLITKPLRSEKEIHALNDLQIEKDLSYVLQTIRLIKKELKEIPLIGFAGSPWTVAAYLVEGKGTKEFIFFRSLLYTAPKLVHDLLTYLARNTTAYLSAQIEAGAQAVMLFDTWAGLLDPTHYLTHSLHYIKEIVTSLKKSFPHIPIILYSKNGDIELETRASSGVDALGLDWTVNIGTARKRVGERVALQGNLDPAVLYASSAIIEKEAKQLLTEAGPTPGYVFNLGHGISKDVPFENVKTLVDAVHQFSRN